MLVALAFCPSGGDLCDSQLALGARGPATAAAFTTSLFSEPHPRLRFRSRPVSPWFSFWSGAGDAFSFPRPSRRCCVGGSQAS